MKHHDQTVAALRGVTKQFGKVRALDQVTLEIEPGKVTSILGPNGAGKTTAIQLLLGLKRPTTGQAELFGGSPHDASSRTRVGVMMQISMVPETLTVQEHIDLFSSYYPARYDLRQVLAAAALEDVANRPYGKLSGGQQRRVAFALALCGDPDLLFLDEPTTGMDVKSRRQFWQQIRDRASEGRTILLTTHYLEEADALSDRIVMLRQGSIIADGSPAEIKSRASARRIRCRTKLNRQQILDLPGVDQVENEGDRVTVLTSNAEAVVSRLLTADPHLCDLDVSGAGLEEVFLSLTSAEAQPGGVS